MTYLNTLAMNRTRSCLNRTMSCLMCSGCLKVSSNLASDAQTPRSRFEISSFESPHPLQGSCPGDTTTTSYGKPS
jgi:hypothetical protein